MVKASHISYDALGFGGDGAELGGPAYGCPWQLAQDAFDIDSVASGRKWGGSRIGLSRTPWSPTAAFEHVFAFWYGCHPGGDVGR